MRVTQLKPPSFQVSLTRAVVARRCIDMRVFTVRPLRSRLGFACGHRPRAKPNLGLRLHGYSQLAGASTCMHKCATLDSACAGEILGATRTRLSQTGAGCFLRFQTQPPPLPVNKETSFTLAPPFFFAPKKASVRKTASSRGRFKLRGLTIDAASSVSSQTKGEAPRANC